MTHGSLFSGIGGFDLAAEWMGWKNEFSCEWNEFGQKILKYYWPNAEHYHDITKTDFTIWRGRIDVLTGGFPCQPFSTAGKRKGTDDSRYLWPEMLRVVREVRPKWIVGENVYGLVNWSGGLVFDTVCADLENEGFKVIPVVLPACGVNAPHQRYRIWFVAYSNHEGGSDGLGQIQGENGEVPQWDNHAEFSDTGERLVSYAQRKGLEGGVWAQKPEGFNEGCEEATSDPNSRIGLERGMHQTRPETTERHFGSFDTWPDWRAWQNFPTVSPVCDGDDGIPRELDGITFSKWRQESIKGGGNAVVPQIPYKIFQAIEQYENLNL